ncbi:hypothetical protein [Sphingomonas sanxanigenens]|uniref:Uncharacterized protein n=1 Tax=Sphingomonas sanxanigenens DSM 19645 = NX02 TaxID=1123269 RepID=W0ADU5_9SPHN|nr:hypothetical protein [Sphingomonas sanxanigenens]AHE56049.1 hypothetical protein NX02_22115 [Sphingomonas sanxanigenens DSM 19645 = NX02]
MKHHIRERADARPRIYIRPCTPAPAHCWSLAPGAVPKLAETPGAALDAALAAIGGGEAVVIVGGLNG